MITLQLPFQTSRRRHRGFTLVEMFIVGALIALFAGIAVFSIQQQFDSNKRKAMIGEARQLGTALGFAKVDLGIYPKFCFLQLSDKQLQYEALYRGYASSDSYAFFRIMDYSGIGTKALSTALISSWQGPYFAASQSRIGSSQGRGGFVNMTIPADNANNVASMTMRWPSDVYGNPWVLYLVSIDINQGLPYFINYNPYSGTYGSARTNPDFFTAVVSYGPNHMPGGGPRADPGLSLVAMNLRLFTGDYRSNNFTLINPGEYDANKAAAISYERFRLPGLAVNDNNQPTGIVDPGSDDIVYEF